MRHDASAGARSGRRRRKGDEPNLCRESAPMTSQPYPPKRIFPTSKVDARAAEHVPSVPQTESVAYKLAFQDTEFLLREDLRAVRFQLELLKPELLLNEAGIA